MYGSQLRSSAPPRRVLVSELEHVVLIKNGRVAGALPPGRHRVSRRKDRLWIESAMPQLMVIPSQEILTSDGATVRVTVAAIVTVADPDVTVRAGEWRSRFHVDVQQALRAAVTSVPLEELVANRTGLDGALQDALAGPASSMGLEVSQLGIRDLVVVGEPRRLLADVVAARLAGQAALERARSETAALRNLANAASLLKDNPDLYRLRLLQEVSSSQGNTFVIGGDAPLT